MYIPCCWEHASAIRICGRRYHTASVAVFIYDISNERRNDKICDESVFFSLRLRTDGDFRYTRCIIIIRRIIRLLGILYTCARAHTLQQLYRGRHHDSTQMHASRWVYFTATTRASVALYTYVCYCVQRRIVFGCTGTYRVLAKILQQYDLQNSYIPIFMYIYRKR